MILASSSLTSPAIGTIFWTVLIFSAFFLILRKFAWKPILSVIKERDELIKGSLASAEKARKEMLKLQSDNEAILQKARQEREGILKEAREIRDKLIAEAKTRATEEAEKIIEKAKTGIEKEKAIALAEIRDKVAVLSVEIAEKILKERLKLTDEHEKIIDSYLNEIDLNRN
ncbi:MAG: F0F1 ATP synthase subunit B [Bacteroidales bacterium]|nr:F0F1 ATP synthase subunit B [Bacteroidales bacterium]